MVEPRTILLTTTTEGAEGELDNMETGAVKQEAVVDSGEATNGAEAGELERNIKTYF